jgi:hypothetical protein
MLAAAKRLWFGVRCSHSRQPGASGIQFFNHGILFRCQTAPWKYSYMFGGMVSFIELPPTLVAVADEVIE